MIELPRNAAEAAAFFVKYELAAVDAGRETRRRFSGDRDSFPLILTSPVGESRADAGGGANGAVEMFGNAAGACVAGSEAVPCVELKRGRGAARAEYCAALTEGTCCRVSPPPLFAGDVASEQDAAGAADEYEELLGKIPGSGTAVAALGGLLLPREIGRATVCAMGAREFARAEALLARLGGILIIPAGDAELLSLALTSSARCVGFTPQCDGEIKMPEPWRVPASDEAIARIASSGRFYTGGVGRKRGEPLINMFLRCLKAGYDAETRQARVIPILRTSALLTEEIKYSWREACGIFGAVTEYNL